MKKIIVILLIFISFSLFGQVSFQQLTEEMNLDATIIDLDGVIYIQDYINIDPTNITYRLSYLLSMIEFYFKLNYYSEQYVIDNYTSLQYTTKQINIQLTPRWLMKYKNLNSTQSADMLARLVEKDFFIFEEQQLLNHRPPPLPLRERK